MFADDLVEAATGLLDRCRARGLRIATAESCTGGLVAGLLTSIAGSSDVFEAGFVTYSNAAKTRMIGVPADLIARHGAVSEVVARAMASGALAHSGASLAVAITGVAGPGGGTALKPVGLVHIAARGREEPGLHRQLLLGDIGRDAIRIASVAAAIEMLYALTEP